MHGFFFLLGYATLFLSGYHSFIGIAIFLIEIISFANLTFQWFQLITVPIYPDKLNEVQEGNPRSKLLGDDSYIELTE